MIGGLDTPSELEPAFKRDRHRSSTVPQVVQDLEGVAVLVGVHYSFVANNDGPRRM